jgi:hypothetical protein
VEDGRVEVLLADALVEPVFDGDVWGADAPLHRKARKWRCWSRMCVTRRRLSIDKEGVDA